MAVVTIILLVVAGAATKADVKEPPYGPSGWKPTGAAFLLPTGNQATTQNINNEPFPPLASPLAFTQLENDRQFTPFQAPAATPRFSPNAHSLTPNDRQHKSSMERQFTPPFQMPSSTPSHFSPSTHLSSPATDHRLPALEHPNSRARTNPPNQDNQPFEHKSGSVLSIVRPLEGLSQSDDQALSFKQNQSPSPKQYLPPSVRNDASGSFTDLSPPDDDAGHVANYSPNFSNDDLQYQASLTDSEDPINKPLSPVDKAYAYVSNQPAQEYGVPSLERGSARQNAPKVFFVILPVRQATSTGADNKQIPTQAFASRFSSDQFQFSDTDSTPRRSPRRLNV